MKKRMLAGIVSLVFLLSGCSALLDRDYISITPHTATPTAEGDPSVLRVESYQELVNALIHFINQGIETGTIRLYDAEHIETDLEAACLEVVQEAPIGAYAVEYIKYSVNPVVSYDEANVQITYRRTREQVASIVSATGTTAIRSELRQALFSFSPELVLRISHFDGDEAYIRDLCRQAYYATPAAALDMPEIDVFLYPDEGQQRIVEILLTYDLEPKEQDRRQTLLLAEREALSQTLRDTTGNAQLLAAAQAVLDAGGYDPQGGSTAYDALLEGGADSQGLALAMALLCQELHIEVEIAAGTRDDIPHFWAVVATEHGWRHLDLTRFDQLEDPFQTDAELAAAGYRWDREAVPACGTPEHAETAE